MREWELSTAACALHNILRGLPEDPSLAAKVAEKVAEVADLARAATSDERVEAAHMLRNHPGALALVQILG